MTHEQAVALMRAGAPAPGGVWADLGAGSGTFARALSEVLGPAGLVIAVDRDVRRLEPLGPSALGAPVRTLRADFRRPLELPELDGLLLANALHFVARQESVLRQLVRYLKPGGTALFLEYDTNRASPWNPHPLPALRLRQLAEATGLRAPQERARTPSAFGGRELYLVHAVKA